MWQNTLNFVVLTYLTSLQVTLAQPEGKFFKPYHPYKQPEKSPSHYSMFSKCGRRHSQNQSASNGHKEW